mmetsp:Transcript_33805/g.89521  ORF Transcript_33805/g.89521 Transcript_33805/m.89521 type:complete len:134 (-) Transcript_33805:373-774(-)
MVRRVAVDLTVSEVANPRFETNLPAERSPNQDQSHRSKLPWERSLNSIVAAEAGVATVYQQQVVHEAATRRLSAAEVDQGLLISAAAAHAAEYPPLEVEAVGPSVEDGNQAPLRNEKSVVLAEVQQVETVVAA